MSNYSYLAVDPHGAVMRGTLEVADQSEALRRIKEMGLFPTKLLAAPEPKATKPCRPGPSVLGRPIRLPGLRSRVRMARLAVFTRQLATLVEAGMPLLRGLRVLAEQEESPTLKRVITGISDSIESGNSLTEALSAHPKVFNRLYVNMAKAGEIGGALEITLRRLAEFMEKAQKIRGRVKAAMFYPCAVLCVAAGIVTLMMTFVVPRFRLVFEGLGNGSLPPFTLFVFNLSQALTQHFWILPAVIGAGGFVFVLSLRTVWGRWLFDRLKLALPIVGPLFRKLAISRFSRTLGTLVSNGVPILQALTIVRETAGNVVVGQVVGTLHERVKEGEPIAPTLKGSHVFPALVAGMVDVGEQTGALPEMLMKVADNYDEEVDNATSALTSILEPILIVLLAVIVGSIVIAMFLPILHFDPSATGPRGEE